MYGQRSTVPTNHRNSEHRDHRENRQGRGKRAPLRGGPETSLFSHPYDIGQTLSWQLRVGGIIRFQEPRELLRFRHELLRFGRGRNRFRHFRMVVCRQLSEGEGREVGVIEVCFHETIRGVKGRKSLAVCA